MGISWMIKNKYLAIFTFLFTLVGFLLHAYGLISRMIIMQRPPVTTLYESIIFVGFITVLGSLVVEKFRKNGLGIFVSTVVVIILHFV